MENSDRLSELSSCPACRARLADGAQSCAVCGLPLVGETATELWRVSVEAEQLLEYRNQLIERLRHERWANTASSSAEEPQFAASASDSQHPDPGPSRVPTPEVSPFPVRTLLLSLGVLLLVVAAVIFLTVAWGRLGVGGRAAILAAVTALSAASVRMTYRRGLRATAESLAALTLAFAILDALGAYTAGLGGLNTVPGSLYWAAVTLLLTMLASAAARAVPLVIPQLAAAAAAQLPLPLLAAYGAGQVSSPALLAGATLGAHAGLLVPMVARLRGQELVRRAWLILAGCAPLAFAAALGFAAVAAFGGPRAPVPGCLLLVALATVAGLAARLSADYMPVRETSAAATALPLLLAATAASWPYVPGSWRLTVVAALSLAGLGLAQEVPRRWQFGPIAVYAVVPGIGALIAAGWFAAALLGPLGWLTEPWSAARNESASAVFTPFGPWTAGIDVPALAVIGAAAAALLVRTFVLTRLTGHIAAGGGIVVAVLLPLTLSLPYSLTVLGEVVLATGLLLAGLVWQHRTLRWVRIPGAVLLGTALAWSLAAPATTVFVLWLALCGLVAAVPLVPAPVRGVTATLPFVLGFAESVAVSRYVGVPWPLTGLVLAVAASLVLLAAGFLPRRLDAVLWPVSLVAIAAYLTGTALAATGWDSLAMTLAPGLLAAIIATTRAGGWRHHSWAVASDILFCAEVAAVAAVAGADSAVIGFVIAASAAGAAAASTWVSSQTLPAGQLVSYVSVAIYAFGVVLALGSPDWLALALLIGAVSGGGVAAHPARRSAGWLSGVLLSMSTWVQLVETGVTAPEAYTAPEGVALLVVGYVRFRREHSLSSWVVYGPGLGFVLLPSLARAVTDPALLRPLLLGLAALAALLVGASWRLQAPLLLGGFVLATDALVQLTPYLTQLYAVVPRWVSIGVAGVLVLGIGATYERRLRDLRRVRDALAAMR